MSEPEVSDLLTVDQAISIIDSTPLEALVADVPLQDARGLVLAEDLSADRDYPPFDKSLMDGFAVRSADVKSIPAELKLVSEIPAGAAAERALQAGEAMAIMTGAPLPQGADGVVPVENVADASVGIGATVRILRADLPQRYVSRAGADMRAGTLVLKAGIRMESPQLAVAATIGAARLKVHPLPRVAIFSTGNELVGFDRKPELTQTRSSNNIMLTALLHRLHARPVDMGMIPDKPEAIRQALIRGMMLDALIVTGGMSMGKYDFVPGLLGELGVEMKIRKLRIKPGKPFIFGIIDRASIQSHLKKWEEMPIPGDPSGPCYVFGLPGNPVSGFVCTLRLVSRLLSRLGGSMPQDNWLPARLAAPVAPNGPREFYQPATLEYAPDGLVAHPLDWKGSADVFTLANADALILRPENAPALAAGATVPCLKFAL